jgi:hypothetical protein
LFDEYFKDDEVSICLESPPLRCPGEAQTNASITFYFGEYALDMPRELFGSIHSPSLYRSGAGWNLAGGCRLTLWIDDELGLAHTLRDLADNFDLTAEGLPAVADAMPDYQDVLRPALRRQLSFANDFEVMREMFATSFRDVSIDRMNLPELITAAALAGLKPIVARTGAVQHMRLVETRHLRGFLYGDPDAVPQTWVELHDEGHHVIRITFTCFERWNPDRRPLRRDRDALLCSVRRHESATPGADLVAAARRELAAGSDTKAEEIARCLLLCASRYDDAYDDAVEMAKPLIRPQLPYAREYWGVLLHADRRAPSP